MTRPRPLKYGLETESETSPSLEYYNTDMQHSFSLNIG